MCLWITTFALKNAAYNNWKRIAVNGQASMNPPMSNCQCHHQWPQSQSHTSTPSPTFLQVTSLTHKEISHSHPLYWQYKEFYINNSCLFLLPHWWFLFQLLSHTHVYKNNNICMFIKIIYKEKIKIQYVLTHWVKIQLMLIWYKR